MTLEEILRDLVAQVECGLGEDDRVIARTADMCRVAVDAEVWREMGAADTSQVSVGLHRVSTGARKRLAKEST